MTNEQLAQAISALYRQMQELSGQMQQLSEQMQQLTNYAGLNGPTEEVAQENDLPRNVLK